MASPYVMVGGYIDTEFEESGTLEFDQLSLSANLNPSNENPVLLWRYQSDPIFQFCGSGHPRAVLDDRMVRSGRTGTYFFDARYNISFDSRNKGQGRSVPLKYGQSGLMSIKIVADLQVNPGSLPALRLGRNVIRYSDETKGAHEVKVIYKWRERWDHVPDPPASAIAPQDSETVGSLAPRLEWTPAGDADGDQIVNYQVKISLRPDCAWPVASTLERDIQGGTAFQVPRGWLMPQTVYYWQVRAESSGGNLGHWSKVFSFRTPSR
jgi:hypothetical protein